jgi:EmrB/QacA subfamily drug resistance transporter
MTALDATIVNVALPRIGVTFGAGMQSLQWIVNAYTLTLAGLLLISGSLGDRIGRRKIFLVGTIWFALASAGCALAPTAGVLIAMRALQGVGGALLTPGSLAILQAVFAREDRSAAVGAWSGFGGIAVAIGPVLGGALTQIAPWGWRLAFLLNLPLAAGVIWVVRRHVPESRDETAAGGVDLPGALLAALGLAGLTFALTAGPDTGWGPLQIAILVGGAAALCAFVIVEGRQPHPMVPLSLFRARQFSAANLTTLLVYAALGGAFFLLPLQLQKVMGLTPIAAGSSLLPITVIMFLLSARMGRLAQTLGPRLPMSVGPLIAAAGLAWMGRIGADSSYLGAVLPPVLLFGLGLACTVAPLTATALSAAPNHLAGVASAINNDVARTGSLLAVAVLPPLAGITQRAGDLSIALAKGFPWAVLIAAATCAAGGIVAAVGIRNEASKD